jgi:hypothetical protein
MAMPDDGGVTTRRRGRRGEEPDVRDTRKVLVVGVGTWARRSGFPTPSALPGGGRRRDGERDEGGQDGEDGVTLTAGGRSGCSNPAADRLEAAADGARSAMVAGCTGMEQEGQEVGHRGGPYRSNTGAATSSAPGRPDLETLTIPCVTDIREPHRAGLLPLGRAGVGSPVRALMPGRPSAPWIRTTSPTGKK